MSNLLNHSYLVNILLSASHVGTDTANYESAVVPVEITIILACQSLTRARASMVTRHQWDQWLISLRKPAQIELDLHFVRRSGGFVSRVRGSGHHDRIMTLRLFASWRCSPCICQLDLWRVCHREHPVVFLLYWDQPKAHPRSHPVVTFTKALKVFSVSCPFTQARK